MSSAIAGASLSAAQSFSTSFGDTFTGVLNDSNLWISETYFGVRLEYDGTTNGPLFINNVQIRDGINFNSLIDLNPSFDYAGTTNGNFEFETYTPGTAITEDVNWDFFSLVRRSGVIDSAVATGTYDFEVDIVGGSDDQASDLLQTFTFNIEVVEQLQASVTANVNPASVGWGDTLNVEATLFNSGSRDVITTTWYVAGFGLDEPGAPAPNQLNLDSFQGDWFDKTISGGNSRTDDHTRWTVPNGVSAGTYRGNVGIVGGYYSGDRHLLRANPDVNVQVVPEPVTLSALGLGLLGVLRRRRAN